MKRSLSFAAVFAMLSGLACTRVDSCVEIGDVSPPAVPAVKQVAADATDKDWGTIKGRIVWAGDKLPEPAEINLGGHKDQMHCLSKGKLYSEEWVVDKDSKGIKWVIVWLTPEPGADKKLAIHPALEEVKGTEVMDQPCCQFVPHALAMRAGQTLVAKNSAPVGHNFNYGGHPLRNPGGNILVPAGGSADIKGLKADGRTAITVTCNIHGWMKAWVRVFDHPYFAVTDKDGNFEIKDAPAGDWRLKIWHETGWRNGAAGKDGEKVTVKGGSTTDLGKYDMKP